LYLFQHLNNAKIEHNYSICVLGEKGVKAPTHYGPSRTTCLSLSSVRNCNDRSAQVLYNSWQQIFIQPGIFHWERRLRRLVR